MWIIVDGYEFARTLPGNQRFDEEKSPCSPDGRAKNANAVAPALAQQGPVKIVGLVELSGTGATSGTNFDNGVKLAVKEIDAAGGILGRKIDYTTDPGQVDFSGAVLKVQQSNADAVFVYTNEEESARGLRELKKQGYNKPIIGETTLTGQKVIELAGDAANGAVAHVG